MILPTLEITDNGVTQNVSNNEHSGGVTLVKSSGGRYGPIYFNINA